MGNTPVYSPYLKVTPYSKHNHVLSIYNAFLIGGSWYKSPVYDLKVSRSNMWEKIYSISSTKTHCHPMKNVTIRGLLFIQQTAYIQGVKYY